MTTIAVTGASGQLGHLIVESLLARGVAADTLVAIARTTSKAGDLAERGVSVRHGDYTDPASLDAALIGVDRLVLVSGSEPGQRAAQHASVIAAAERAGVGRIVYTSLINADHTSNGLAPEHVATEQALASSPVSSTILRNSWYFENYTAQIPTYTATGTLVGATDGARISAATRADYAEAAAAAVLADEAGATYELAGPSFTFDDLAAAVSEATGTPVEHRDVTVEELAAILQDAAGMDAGTAGFWASIDGSIAAGDLHSESTDLADLIGREPTSLTAAVRAAL